MQANYLSVVNLLKSNENIGPKKEGILVCDSTWLKWVVKMRDMIPSLPANDARGDQTVAQYWHQNVDPGMDPDPGTLRASSLMLGNAKWRSGKSWLLLQQDQQCFRNA